MATHESHQGHAGTRRDKRLAGRPGAGASVVGRLVVEALHHQAYVMGAILEGCPDIAPA